MAPKVYGIGNPLIDVVISSTDKDLKNLELSKGVMHLVDESRQSEIIQYFKKSTPQYFTPDGERTMNTHLGMCREFSPADIDEKKLAQSTFFYFTGYMWDTDSQKAAIKKAISIAKENNVHIVFDVADPFAVDRNKDDFLIMIEHDVDVLFANYAELAILFDSENVDSSADQLMKIVHRAGIKLGKKGSLVLDDGKKYHLPPQPISAIDSTGAGDMYAAGFLTALAKGYSIKRAGEIGGLLAEEIIQQSGAQFAIDKINFLRINFFI